MDEILDLIPQRSPFLFVDKIVDRGEKKIHVQKTLTGNEDFFKGHFPGNPIMPGVLLCEATFQAGALLVSAGQDAKAQLAVVSRIKNTKFKEIVRPKVTLDIFVELTEQVSNAYFMSGRIEINNKIVMSDEFVCSLLEQP